jgi:ACS family allantoate permease-like MFS transporter
MDKVTTATAALYGFRADTGLTGDRYSWVGSAFYFGYLFWCLPSGSLLQRYPIAKLMFVVQLLWGCILIATGFANNFPTLMALRVCSEPWKLPLSPEISSLLACGTLDANSRCALVSCTLG